MSTLTLGRAKAPRRARLVPPLMILQTAAAAAIVSVAGHAANEFRAQESYSAGSAPSSVASGDVTGGGKPDLV